MVLWDPTVDETEMEDVCTCVVVHVCVYVCVLCVCARVWVGGRVHVYE